MDGKALLFKDFAGDAFFICLATQDVDETVYAIKYIAPIFGGINLEDISAPRCFEIKRRLKEKLDIPVFHDDQHGTAIVVLAGVINALKIVGKDMEKVSFVINGAGATGVAIAKLLLKSWSDMVVCDRKGAIYQGGEGMDWSKEKLAQIINNSGIKGELSEAMAMRGSDVFVGVSATGVVTRDMVASIARNPVLFAMANPVPEIFSDETRAGGAKVDGPGTDSDLAG